MATEQMDGNLDPDALETALQTLLRRYPEAPVAAVNSSGIYVEMPSSVPLTGQRIIEARSSLHFVVASDRKAVTDAFHRAVLQGASSVAVHPANDPDRTANLCYFDLRERHGVFVLVVAEYTGSGNVHAIVSQETVRPRFCFVKKNETSVFLDTDDATMKMLGWSPDQMIGRRSIDFIHPDDQGRAIDSWMEMAAAPGGSSRARLRHLCRDGSWRWLEITNTNMMSEPERCVMAELADISDEMAALESVRAREQLLNRLAEALPLGLLQVGQDRRVVYANDRLHQIVGAPLATTVDDQMTNAANEDGPPLRRTIDDVLENGADLEIDVRFQLPGESYQKLCALSFRALTSETDELSGFIACVSDITESARMHHELERLAMLDTVTECHNRRSIMEILDLSLARHSPEAPGTAVIFVDIDHFKRVNDTFGHAAGDELLKVVADRLRGTVRGEDIVGRIGGDEFLVVCPATSTADDVVNLARRIADVLGTDVSLGLGVVDTQSSVGVAWTNSVGIDADTLVGQADAAMYESKRGGAGRPVLFNRSLRTYTGPPVSEGPELRVPDDSRGQGFPAAG